jgi:hypothetical protein
MLETDFPGDIADGVVICMGETIDNHTDIQIRLPGRIATRTRAKGPDIGVGILIPHASGKQV